VEIVNEKQFLKVDERILKMSELFGLSRLEMQKKAQESGLLKNIVQKDINSQIVTRE
jgi:hypothetical protein